MTSFAVPPVGDPIRPEPAPGIRLTLDGRQVEGLAGQTIGGVLLGAGVLNWRTTSKNARPRGIFCGIGVCFDCLVEVNGQRDVRACQRRAAEGDVVVTQYDALPGEVLGSRLPGEGDARA